MDQDETMGNERNAAVKSPPKLGQCISSSVRLFNILCHLAHCQAWGYLTKTSCQDERQKSMFICLLNFNTNTCHGCLCRPSKPNLVYQKSRKVKKKQAITICLLNVMQTTIGLNEFFQHFSDGLGIKLHLSRSLRQIFLKPLRSSATKYMVIHLPVNLTSIYLVLHYASYVSFNTHIHLLMLF